MSPHEISMQSRHIRMNIIHLEDPLCADLPLSVLRSDDDESSPRESARSSRIRGDALRTFRPRALSYPVRHICRRRKTGTRATGPLFLRLGRPSRRRGPWRSGAGLAVSNQSAPRAIRTRRNPPPERMRRWRGWSLFHANSVQESPAHSIDRAFGDKPAPCRRHCLLELGPAVAAGADVVAYCVDDGLGFRRQRLEACARP